MIQQRSLALDVFRGLAVALMILVNNPGSWSHVYSPLEHAHWHGLTLADLVFPFFLFAVGNAQALVLPRMWEKNSRQYFFKKVLRRTVVIFLIGLLLNWWPFLSWSGDELVWKNLRIMGVLQRIALAYGASAILTYYFPRKVLTLSCGLLLFYWLLCVILGSGDIYSLEGWFGTNIDRALMGAKFLYQGEGVAFDPEGLMSTLPAISQVMLGYWTCRILNAYNPRKIRRSLLKRGCVLLAIGVLWHFFHPINKKIWTGSYVLVTTGLAIILLTLLVHCLDLKQRRGKLFDFLAAFGKNPLFIFVLSGLIPRTLSLIRLGEEKLNPLQWFYQNVCTKFPGPPENGSLLYALIMVGIFGALALWLDRRRTYFRI